MTNTTGSICLLVTLALLAPTTLAGASEDRGSLFGRLMSDQAFLITTWWPSEVKRFEFTIPLSVAVLGASGSWSGSGLDADLQRSIRGWTDGGHRHIAKRITTLGDTKVALAMLGGTYLVARWSGKSRLQRTTSLATEALINAGLYNSVLKNLTKRSRPWATQAGVPNGTSFPSGHAMGSFAVATVLASEYRHKRWVPWLAYGTASLVALSRVGLNRHYPSDVLAGAVLGRSMGRMVVTRHGGGAERAEARWKPQFSPLVDPAGRSYGVSVRLSW